MSSITRCTAVHRPQRVMPAPTLLKAVAVMGMIVFLALAQLHLRFTLDAMRIETIRLQTQQGTLTSQINALRGQTEALKSPQRLIELACVDLGMVPCRTGDRHSVLMPEEVSGRYAAARTARERELAMEPAAGAEAAGIWVEALSARLGLTGEAQARESRVAK